MRPQRWQPTRLRHPQDSLECSQEHCSGLPFPSPTYRIAHPLKEQIKFFVRYIIAQYLQKVCFTIIDSTNYISIFPSFSPILLPFCFFFLLSFPPTFLPDTTMNKIMFDLKGDTGSLIYKSQLMTVDSRSLRLQR